MTTCGAKGFQQDCVEASVAPKCRKQAAIDRR
jgi:hypothetical protein